MPVIQDLKYIFLTLRMDPDRGYEDYYELLPRRIEELKLWHDPNWDAIDEVVTYVYLNRS